MILVNKIDENTFNVTVEDVITTNHRVEVPEDYYQKLTSGEKSKEILVEKSFQFLLEHESNGMIFSEFSLPIIQSYFSSYESEIKKRL